MDPRTVIVQRIDLHLRRHLGEGIDPDRTLNDLRYQRDVLFVCDAMAGTELPKLARRFRVAGELIAQERARGGHEAGPPQDWACDTSGFGVSQPPQPGEVPVGKAPAAWLSPRRWFLRRGAI